MAVTRIDPKTWYAQLPSFYATTAALITEAGTGRVLLVKPTYRDHWTFPGGYLEADEYPHDGCAREIREELGLHLQPGPLLLVDWAPAAEPRPRPLISLTFDCGELAPDIPIRLDDDELSAWAFLNEHEAAARLPGNVAPRVAAALYARRDRTTVYLGNSNPFTT
jgi:ADP-ribose pyrophosphatase YjhB (NUDIX family)